MQKITVSDVSIKTGTGEKGDWIATTITDEKGAKYSSFDKSLSHLTKGTLLEIEPEVKGKYINIKEFKVLEAQPTTDQKPNVKTAEQHFSERASIEVQTAVKAVLDLAKIIPTDDNFKSVYQKALQWCEQAIDRELIKPTTKPQSSPQPAQSKSEAVAEPTNGNPQTDLFAWLNESMGKNWKEGAWRSWLKNVCKIDELQIDINPEEVKKQVAELQGWK